MCLLVRIVSRRLSEAKLTRLLNILKQALFLSAVFFPAFGLSQNEKVRLVFAETVENSNKFANTTKAKGNVEFEYNQSRLFCDSALYFRDFDIVHAYGDVQINQGDTINIYGDSLKYFGKENLSKISGNVRFRDNEYKLVTDSMDYDGNRSMGYYTNWATISSIHEDLELRSIKGYYQSEQKTFFFKDSVHAIHPQYELFSDTLEFRTASNTAHFHGPTTMYLDSGRSKVICTKGIYYSDEERIQLWNGAHLIDSNRTIYADSLVFNQQTDEGEGFCNVDMYDSLEQVRFLSDYMKKYQNNEKIILKENARVVQFGKGDTLFLLADTITHYRDTVTEMSETVAENNVKIINGDLYVRTDSAWFSEKDSLMKLYYEPIMWSKNTQMTADSIQADYYDKEFHELRMYNNAMIISDHTDDSVHYDQIKGKFMTAYLDSGKIDLVYIQINAQTLYYVAKTEKDSLEQEYEVIDGMNKIDCNEINIYFKDSEIDNIAFIDQPTSIYYPINRVPLKDLYLKGFDWKIARKPRPIYIE